MNAMRKWIGFKGSLAGALLLAGILAWVARLGAIPTQRIDETVSVTTAATTLFQKDLGGEAAYANIEIANATGGDAFATCLVQFRDAAGGEWHTVLSGADYATASATLPFCSSTSPATLAAGSTAHLVVNLYAADGLRVVATSAGTSSATVQATIRAVAGGLH